MKKLIYILLLSVVFNSCDLINCCTEINTRIDIKYTDIEGNYILGMKNGINSEQIKLYYKVNNEWEEYYKEKLNYPKGYFVSDERGGNYICLFPSDEFFNNNFSETKIQFSDNDFDIIKCQFNLDNNSIICNKVWYNNELKWEGDGNEERLIEIIK